jgi:PAS domain S-box-containing protein
VGRPTWTEADRLAALDRYDILDTPTEPLFDNLVTLAAEICEAPIAVVNFITSGRQWFKAEKGIGVREMPLDVSICRHVLLPSGLTVVPDLRLDPRFDGNPLVTSDGGLRFYAGALVETPEGLPLGTVCILDTRPRPEGLDARQGRLLLALARQVVAELELRRAGQEREAEIARLRAAEEELRSSERRFRSLFEQVAVGVAHSDLSGRWIVVNRRMAEILGYDDPSELVGRTFVKLTHPDDRDKDEAALREHGKDPSWIYRRRKRYLRRDGSPVWVGLTVSTVADGSGRPSHRVAVVEDETERHSAEEREREAQEQLRAQADELAALFAAAPVGLTVLDSDLRFVRINERLAEINGLPMADHIGRTVREVLPDIAGQAEPALLRVLAGETVFGIELSGTTPAQPGVLRTWRENWLPLRDAHGEITGITISAEEVTAEKAEERRQAFRLALTERLRDIEDPQAIVDAATELLGRHLGVAQVGFGEIDEAGEHVIVHRDWNDGSIPSIVGTWRMEDFGPDFIRDMKVGQTAVIPDVREDPRTRALEVLRSYEGIRTRSILDVPHLRDGRMVAMLFVHHPEPRAWSAEEVALVEEACGRLWSAVERARAEARLRSSEARFRALFEQTPLLVHIFDPSGRTVMVNPALLSTYGMPAEAAMAYNVLEDPQPFTSGARAQLERAFFDGEVMRTPPLRHDSAREAGARRLPWIESVGFPIKDEAGRIQEVVLLSQDVTERVESEERERLLTREVDHRAKNMLAVVQAVVELTRAEDIAAFKAAVAGRIRSLSRAHSLLAAARWEGVEIGQLAADELAAFDRPGRDCVRLDGPRLMLRPAAAQALGLVLHELATNAAKYGALSASVGTVDLTWREREGQFELCWRESGGPPVEPPKRRGFGSMLIRQSVERQLGGVLQLDWRPEGLSARLVLPADQIGGSQVTTSMMSPEPAPARHPGTLAGRRVLVVEDEALISLQLASAVAELGGRVVGPAATVAEALRLVAQGELDAAVLDLNLGGERSDPVARALREAGVPFVLSTGYGDDMELSSPFGDSRRLGKPIGSAALAEALSTLVPAEG